MLTTISKDYSTLPAAMLSQFKEHIRILDEIEDDIISLYLAGAIDAISTYSDRDIFYTTYRYESFAADEVSYNTTFWRCGREKISNVIVKDKDDIDITDQFTIDTNLGYIAPAPVDTDIVTFTSGYDSGSDIPPNLKTIIYRYGAHLFEDRESIKIGDPKNLPDWVNFAIASIWVPRS